MSINKIGLNRSITQAQELGVYDLADNDKVRVVVEDAGGSNEVEISVKLDGQSSWKLLKTIVGSDSENLDTDTYDFLKIECTVFDGTRIKVLASGFKIG